MLQPLFSLFIDNLYEELDQFILWKYFKVIGDVKEVYIPKRMRQGRKVRYAFERFSDPWEARHVAFTCNGD